MAPGAIPVPVLGDHTTVDSRASARWPRGTRSLRALAAEDTLERFVCVSPD
jgi:hypothetical protein